MAGIVNYYEELGIGKELGLGEINAEIVKLKRVWIQREINQPEKARRMLVLIDDAEAAFRSESTRAKYDRDLEQASRESASNINPEKQEYEKWTNSTREYAGTRQYDLALIALEKALTFSQAHEDEELLCLAASIYKENKNYNAALRSINEAIIISPQTSVYYYNKGQIFSAMLDEGRMTITDDQWNDYVKKELEAYKAAYVKAAENGETGDGVSAYSERIVKNLFSRVCFSRELRNFEELEVAAMEAGDRLGGRGILDYIVLWEKSAGDRKADRIFTERMRWLLKIALSITDKSGNTQDKAEILGIYTHSLYFDNPRDPGQAEQCAREALQLGETWGNAQAVLDAVKQANEAAERQRKEYEARQKAEQEKREREERRRREAEQKRERDEQRRREEELRAREELHRKQEEIRHKRKCWNRLFIISIILCVLYLLSPLLITIKSTFAYIGLADYFICSSLLCMSSAVKYDAWPIPLFLLCLFCFGIAMGLNEVGHLHLPFGRFMAAWCIVVGIFSAIGVRIGDSLSREEGIFKC